MLTGVLLTAVVELADLFSFRVLTLVGTRLDLAPWLRAAGVAVVLIGLLQGVRTELLQPRQDRRRRLDLLGAYLKAVRDSSERLPYLALRDNAPPLSAIYVPRAALQRQAPARHAAQGAPTPPDAPLLPPLPETIEQALGHGLHLLVEGEPGTGKSSLLQQAAQVAEAGLDQPAGRRPLVPVQVSARAGGRPGWCWSTPWTRSSTGAAAPTSYAPSTVMPPTSNRPTASC